MLTLQSFCTMQTILTGGGGGAPGTLGTWAGLGKWGGPGMPGALLSECFPTLEVSFCQEALSPSLAVYRLHREGCSD